MKGNKNRTRRVLVPAFLVIVFSLFTVFVAADDVFINQLYSRLQVSNQKIGNQNANLIGALSVDGYTYSDTGYISRQDNNTPGSGDTDQNLDNQLLTQTEKGATCIGNCDPKQDSIVINADLTPEASSTGGGSTLVSTSTDQESTVDTVSQTASTSASVGDDEVVIETEQETTEETIAVVKEKTGSSSRGSSQTNSEEDTDTDTDTDGIEFEEPNFELTEDELAQMTMLEQFTYKLSRMVFVVGDKIGIGDSNPLFSLSVKGWLYSNKGFLTGPADNPIGFGMTEQGICLGSCDFDIPDKDIVVETTTLTASTSSEDLSETSESVVSNIGLKQDSNTFSENNEDTKVDLLASTTVITASNAVDTVSTSSSIDLSAVSTSTATNDLDLEIQSDTEQETAADESVATSSPGVFVQEEEKEESSTVSTTTEEEIELVVVDNQEQNTATGTIIDIEPGKETNINESDE